jgi:hypothetical protein
MGEGMSVKSLAEIMEEMRQRYQRSRKEKEGWRMLAGTDSKGYSDLFFYGPKAGLWQIKGELKSPYEMVGAGARVVARRVDDEIRELMEQGHPLPFGLLSPHPEHKDRVIIATGIGRYSESTERLKEFLPGGKHEVDLELRRKLDRMRRELGLDMGYG